MIRKVVLALASATLLLALTCVVKADAVSVISSNFNGTSIAAGNTIWFNSHMKVTGLSSLKPTTVNITNVTVALGGQTYTLPDATITFSPTATAASTHFDAATNRWITIVPTSQAGADPFMTGFGLLLPNGLAGGQNPVIMQATFSTDAANLSIDWQWSAAVYTDFADDYNDLGVLSVDGGGQSGTPTSYERFVIGGARGGGGSNFTGSNSATGHVQLSGGAPVPEPATLILLGSGLAGVAASLRRRRTRKNAEDA